MTKVALERSRMILSASDWGAREGNEYWRTLLENLTMTSIQLPDEAMYVPLGRKMPNGKPGSANMLSAIAVNLALVPWVDLDPTLVQRLHAGCLEAPTPAPRRGRDYSKWRRARRAGGSFLQFSPQCN